MSALLLLAKHIQQKAQFSNHRQILRLRGDLNWCYQQAITLTSSLEKNFFWCGSSPVEITASNYKASLGQDIPLLIINAHSSFDANAFAACEGALVGGGLLLLLTPSEIASNDLFYHYIDKQLGQYAFTTIQQDQAIVVPATEIEPSTCNLPLNLEQQKLAVAAIIKTVTGHRRRPLVLTANRGRGKSAALGIAAADLLNSGLKTILVCAPNKAATITLFKHAGLMLSDYEQLPFSISNRQQKLQFIAPDMLQADKPHCDLLILDEAAAIPVPILEVLTHHYSRLVFATTLHGYEGSGRGFALRFQKRLNEIAPQWRQLHLEQPIRWADNDPVEHFTLNNLCLTESPSEKTNFDSQKTVQFETITAQQLVANKLSLQEIFSLLVNAHYQTKPSDLEQLLNDHCLSIFVLRQEKQLLGVALINAEGGLDPELSEKIWQGQRRIQGNLVAQSLAFHSGFQQAAQHRYARIQRIAIQPQCQQQGLGKLFISHLKNWAKEEQFDHLCASFGATADLLSFWQQQQFSSLRVGASRDSSSGTHSIIVNLPLSDRGTLLHTEVQQQFQLQLPMQLTRHLQNIETELISVLLNEFPKRQFSNPQLISYIEGNRPYQTVEYELLELLLNSDVNTLTLQQRTLTIQKVLQNNSWAEICNKQGYTGKKQAQSKLKDAIKQLLEEESNEIR